MKVKDLLFFVSPFFVNRFYLLNNTKRVINKYKFSGSVLDVGCGTKPYKNLFINSKKYVGIDFKKHSSSNAGSVSNPDYYFDKAYKNDQRLPFEDNSYDHAVCFQVIEHHNNPTKLVAELRRIVKPNGLIWITVPFLVGLHEEPHDFQRFTTYGLRELVRAKFKILEIKNIGSVCSVVSYTINSHLTNISNKNTFSYLIALLLYPPFLLFQYVSIAIDQVVKSKQICIGYSMVAKNIMLK